MALHNINPTTTQAWKKLVSHFEKTQHKSIKSLFDADSNRASKFTLKWNDFLVDYSKNRIDEDTITLLLELAKEVKLDAAIEQYFGGAAINQTEGRAVLHTALRAKDTDTVLVDGVNVIPEVYKVREHIKRFSDAIISGNKKGYTGKAFTDVVNIGIGGSDLGPAMVTEALKFYKNHLKVHFVSNVDGDHVQEIMFPKHLQHRKH